MQCRHAHRYLWRQADLFSFRLLVHVIDIRIIGVIIVFVIDHIAADDVDALVEDLKDESRAEGKKKMFVVGRWEHTRKHSNQPLVTACKRSIVSNSSNSSNSGRIVIEISEENYKILEMCTLRATARSVCLADAAAAARDAMMRRESAARDS